MPDRMGRSQAELLASSIKNLDEACKADGKEPTYQNNLGLSKFEAEDFDGALHAYE